MNDEAQAACNSSDYWSGRYRSGDAPWDLREETAVFAALRRTDPLFMPRSDESRSVLVPGCGYGHDALSFARHGFHVTAVDFAPEPLVRLRAEADRADLHLAVLERDVFTLGWDLGGSFDIILEYTCYCALDPSRREEYVRTLGAVTKPGGLVAGLFWPAPTTCWVSWPTSPPPPRARRRTASSSPACDPTDRCAAT
ncbi:MAG: class I SAM-dependent methyltransferase, partial [Candidatus Kapaibacterium sp.]